MSQVQSVKILHLLHHLIVRPLGAQRAKLPVEPGAAHHQLDARAEARKARPRDARKHVVVLRVRARREAHLERRLGPELARLQEF